MKNQEQEHELMKKPQQEHQRCRLLAADRCHSFFRPAYPPLLGTLTSADLKCPIPQYTALLPTVKACGQPALLDPVQPCFKTVRPLGWRLENTDMGSQTLMHELPDPGHQCIFANQPINITRLLTRDRQHYWRLAVECSPRPDPDQMAGQWLS